MKIEANNIKPEKILEYKTYNSIGHLSTSRLGEKDRHIDANQEHIFTKQVANNQQLVIVQEKLDGSNVCVVNINGELIALSRSGYRCSDSDQEQHRMFARYVEKHKERFKSLLPYNHDRVVGEWLALAHGTIYENIKDPFVPFDLFRTNGFHLQSRVPLPLGFVEFCFSVSRHGFSMPKVLHIGGSCSINRAEKLLNEHSKTAEGVVYRLEENSTFKSIAKFVKHDKEDGKYLKEGILHWNWKE